MPSFATQKRLYSDLVTGEVLTHGQLKKHQSDMIMEDTWWNDIASRVGYLYDWYHDDYKTILNDLDSRNDPKKIPIDMKYLVNSSQTMAKDPITYHLQLRPSQQINVPYYEEFFGKRYSATFPCGLYVDIEDACGKYNRWLVVACANSNDPQFRTYELLRCDYVFQWIMDGKKFNMPGVLRSQNSYSYALRSGNTTSKVL